ncbi:MAG TPA: hypothetical protein VI197_00615 [Polyangiaceae bacterium]
MTRRLVVCLRWRPRDQDAGADAFAAAASAILERLATLGGRLILWHPEWLCVDFGIDGLQDAIDFIVDHPHEEFSTGFAYGTLHELVDGGPMLAACLGPVIESAMALARMARAGDVLVEPGLVKASGGELLVQGARVATIGSTRVRGFRLDMEHPQRSLECESVAQLSAPPFRARLPAFEARTGALCVLSALRGGGGSRALDEQRKAQHPESLVFSANATGVPLGALRSALAQSRMLTGDLPPLSPGAQAAWNSLSQGTGCSRQAGALLLGEWARARSAAGIVYVEDVAEIDFDSLEVLALCVEAGELGAVVLAESGASLPVPLGEVAVSQSHTLPELSLQDAATLLQSMTGNELAAEWAERLAARGLPTPLGVTQSLVEALDSASFLWTDAGVVPRVPRDEPLQPELPLLLLRRRLHFVEMTERLLLEAIAVLGGRAERSQLASLLKLAGRSVNNADAAFAFLERLGWIAIEAGDRVALTTRTHRRAIVASLSDKRFRALHQAAATLAVDSAEPLALVSAALHAALAGNVGKATLLARRALAPLAAAGLDATAQAVEEFAAAADLDRLRQRGLQWSETGAERALVASDDSADASAPEAARRTETLPAEAPSEARSAGERRDSAGPRLSARRSSDTPERPSARALADGSVPRAPAAPDLPLSELVGSVDAGEDVAAAADPEREVVSDGDIEAMSAEDSELKPASEEPEGDVHAVAEAAHLAGAEANGGTRAAPTLRVAGVPSNDSLMPERASLALQRGDPVTLDQLARQLRSEAHNMLADRLDAMACLVRGNTGEALRRLRDAKQRARQLSLSEQCRASLALSVAIAAAGRPIDAMLEALEGLAQARRGGDLRGERACAKFLAQLAHKAGQDQIAGAWQDLSVSPSLHPSP